MSKRRRPAEIVAKLRQVEVLHAQGLSIAEAIRQIGVSELTFHRWRKRRGGMRTEQLKELKRLRKGEPSSAIGPGSRARFATGSRTAGRRRASGWSRT